MAEPDERYERALGRLLGMLGTVDPAGAGIQSALEECASALPRGGLPLPRLQRLVALNALVQDAVGRECDEQCGNEKRGTSQDPEGGGEHRGQQHISCPPSP